MVLTSFDFYFIFHFYHINRFASLQKLIDFKSNFIIILEKFNTIFRKCRITDIAISLVIEIIIPKTGGCPKIAFSKVGRYNNIQNGDDGRDATGGPLRNDLECK